MKFPQTHVTGNCNPPSHPNPQNTLSFLFQRSSLVLKVVDGIVDGCLIIWDDAVYTHHCLHILLVVHRRSALVSRSVRRRRFRRRYPVFLVRWSFFIVAPLWAVAWLRVVSPSSILPIIKRTLVGKTLLWVSPVVWGLVFWIPSFLQKVATLRRCLPFFSFIGRLLLEWRFLTGCGCWGTVASTSGWTTSTRCPSVKASSSFIHPTTTKPRGRGVTLLSTIIPSSVVHTAQTTATCSSIVKQGHCCILWTVLPTEKTHTSGIWIQFHEVLFKTHKSGCCCLLHSKPVLIFR